MGKSKQQKQNRGHRNQPTGLPSVKEAEAQMEDELCVSAQEVSGNVVGLIEKLQSASPDERECACSTIASVLSQEGAIPQFLQAGVVRVLGPLLVDKSRTIQQAAVGALRNMSVDGGAEVCETMVQQDVMTPLVALLQQESTKSKVEESSPHKKGEVYEIDVTLQAVHLLWNLCESSPVAVKVFNKQNLLENILPNIFSQERGYALAMASAQCVYTVTEDNLDAISHLVKEGIPSMLHGILTSPHSSVEQLLLKTVAAGILNNIGPSGLNSAAGTILGAVVSVAAEVLSHDILSRLQKIAAILSQEAEAGSTFLKEQQKQNAIQLLQYILDNSEPGMDMEEGSGEIKNKELEQLMEETQNLLTAQQLAVEMVANLCCVGDEDEEEWEESSDGSSDEQNGFDSVDDSGDMGDTDLSSLSVPPEVHAAFGAHAIVSKILSKSELPDLSCCHGVESKSQMKKLLKNVYALQSRALLCVGNLVSSLEVSDLGGEQVINQIWSGLSQLAATQKVKENPELLEAVTSALGTVVQKMVDVDSQKLQAVTESDLQFLCDIVQQCSVPQVRANVLRVVSGIGCAMAKQTSAHPQLQNVGLFLLEVVSKDSELWVVAEALDAIFDVFAEDDTDPVLKEIKMVEKLKAVVPALKAKAQQERRYLGDHYPVVSTARMNLIRFIKYKAQR